MTKIWGTPKAQSTLLGYPKPWLYDGRKLAWSTNKVDEIRITVNLDEERGKPANENNTYYVIIRNTGTIRLNALRAYLEGKMDWDNSVLECMSESSPTPSPVPRERRLTPPQTSSTMSFDRARRVECA